MRVKLGLSEQELMNSSWISLQLQMYDYPYYDMKAKNIITDPAKTSSILEKYMNK